MNRIGLLALVFAAALLATRAESALESLPNFDERRPAGDIATPTVPRRAAAGARPQSLQPDVRVDVDAITGSPKWIMSLDRPLTAAGGAGGSVSKDLARRWPAGDPHRATKAFVAAHRELFGHGPEVLETNAPDRDFVTAHNGLRTTVWRQALDGIPVYDAVFIAHVTKAGELLSVSSQFVPDPAAAADAEHPKRKSLQSQPALSAKEAVRRALQNIGETEAAEALALVEVTGAEPTRPHRFRAGGLPGEAHARLVWLPLSGARMRLCWAVEVTRAHRSETFRILVDAETGKLWLRRALTFDLSEATYRVFTSDSPSPFSPGWPSPNTNQPPLIERSLVTLAALNTNASPIGWVSDGEYETRGNNVDAHLDRVSDNLPDLPRPRAPGRVFDFPLDLAQPPTTYSDAATVQLFYWCNWMHDKLWELGFTEAAGNFQKDNFGRGGLGNDPMLADAQDGSGFNNANYTAAYDGTSGRIQMFLFNGPTPFRDADLDAEVILHEYAHGLSDRLVGGGLGISQSQTYGMAEGWSDFYALSLLSEPTDDVDGCYPVGGYMSYLYNGLTENYYYGIRRYPVTTDLSKNPLTFKDIDPNQASFHPGVPRNPISSGGAAEAHRQGEVWCAILWEVRAALIRKYGFDTGNLLALRLVTDSLKLCPPNPNFVQARNAMFQADQVTNGGADRADLWAAFAKRGLGYTATAPDSSTTVGVRESYDLPDFLTITPGYPFVSAGPEGGPFLPPAQTYMLQNSGGATLNWLVVSAPPWVTVAPTGGVLPSGASNTVTVTINSLAGSLAPADYTNDLVFLNQGSQQTLSVQLILRVNEVTPNRTNFLTEIFFGNGDFDLDFTTLNFTPDPATDSYTVCRLPASRLPTDPAGGQTILMTDDCYSLITLAEGKEVALFGTRTNQVLVGSNGDLLFHVPTNRGYQYDPSRQLYTNFFYTDDGTYFDKLRVAPLYVDLHPGMGGTVSWQQLSNRLVVTWWEVPEYGRSNTNTFQVEWFFDGPIRFSYAGVADDIGANLTTPKVGLVRGIGQPPGFVETDFSTERSCLPPLTVLVPAQITEGAGPWPGSILLATPADKSVFVRLELSDTNASTFPEVVEIPPGQSLGEFYLHFQDDDKINGTRQFTLTTVAEDYANTTETIEVHDNETARLTINVPSRAQEGEGLLSGRVFMDQTPDTPITVNLFSSDPAAVQVPPFTVIPAGQTSAPFDLWVAEDTEISGPRFVFIEASVPNWPGDVDAIQVADNEPTNVILLLPTQTIESAGTLVGAGHVGLRGHLATNLLVFLSSDNTNAVAVPAKITLPAGQTAVAFDVTVVDNDFLNGPQLVTVRASPPGFTSAAAAIRVLDDESPSAPTNPVPAHLSTRVNSDVTLLWSVEGAGPAGAMTFDVYLGTNPVPGEAEFLGTTDRPAWALQSLRPGTTYFWRVAVKVQSVTNWGPVWQFTTAGLDHFRLSPVASPQLIDEPFPLTVTAVDENDDVATGFRGAVDLTALVPVDTPSTVVITEVDTGNQDRVEFMNVSGRELDLSGWQMVVYDWSSWPAPRGSLTFPYGTLSLAGDVFQVRRYPAQFGPGTYPIFNFTNNLYWNNNTTRNPVAVLLRDAAGIIVDFVCAVDADPAQITDPLPIPAAHWTGAPVPANENPSLSYQRRGTSDHDNAADWTVATNSIGKTNAQLRVPFFSLETRAITPGVLTNFVGGASSGWVRLHDTATNVFLRVDDGQGHRGTGNVFTVSARDDLAVDLALSAGRQTVGNPFSYLLTVTNTGPTRATGVLLLDTLPAGLTFLSATSTHGTVTQILGTVIGDLGPLDPGAAATVTISVVAGVGGFLTNAATVARLEPETYTPNNSVRFAHYVGYPFLAVADAGVSEGNSGTTNLLFTARLSEPSLEPIVLDFATADGSAIAGSDYAATAGKLVFAPGETNAQFTVVVFGDTLSESNETFVVNLTNTGPALLVRPQATGTITNDDAMPALSLADATVVEGDEGTNLLVFTATLSPVSGRTASASWSTYNGTALALLDYVPVNGRLTFAPGVTNQTLTVPVLGNRLFQSNRTFTVVLAGPVNAYFSRSQAVGTILDDDAALPHHFAWELVGPTQFVNEPFLARLTARNAMNQTVSNYTGVVALAAGISNRLAGGGAGTNRWEFPFGASFHDTRLQVIYPATALGGAGQITALALDVAQLPGQTLSNFTIRLAPTALSGYTAAFWASNWTSVYRADLTLVVTGWNTFPFHTPFDFDGEANLLVDFSFNNATFSTDGFCRVTFTNQNRAAYFRTDGAFGDPLTWSGNANPTPALTNLVPNIRFTLRTPAAVEPQLVSNFVDGVWTGPLTCFTAGAPMTLEARDTAGLTGLSDPFVVIVRDTDADGLPDEWERLHQLDPFNPADAAQDPDHDSLTNLEEFWAGTDPHSAASTLRIVDIRWTGTNNFYNLTFLTVPNRRYQVESARDLNGPWLAGKTNVAIGPLLTVPAGASLTDPVRFFRVKVVP